MLADPHRASNSVVMLFLRRPPPHVVARFKEMGGVKQNPTLSLSPIFRISPPVRPLLSYGFSLTRRVLEEHTLEGISSGKHLLTLWRRLDASDVSSWDPQ